MAVFIDADNLNDPTALDHVLVTIRAHADRVLYRRAYGRPESLKGIEAVLWKHGVRPVANLIVDKVTTDSALVIDAVEAVCTSDIDTVAICSGDADFVPLALWLREKGKRVLCYSLAHKIFANPESFYDDVVILDVVEKTLLESLIPGESVVQIDDESPRRLDNQERKKSAGVQPAPQSQPKSIALSVVVQGSGKRVTVKQILAVLPDLKNKETMHLSQATKGLRDAKLVGKSSSSTTLFRAYPSQFELLPKIQPNAVRFRG